MNLPTKISDWPDERREEYEERAAIIAADQGPECVLDIRKEDPSGLRKISETRAEQDIRKLVSKRRES